MFLTLCSRYSITRKVSTSAFVSTSWMAVKRVKGLIFTGSEGTMEIAGSSVIVSRTPREREPGYSVGTFTEATQKSTIAAYRAKYPETKPDSTPALAYERFSAPEHYSDSYDHFNTFFNAVRTRTPVTEDAVFGFRAAGAALLSNLSYERDSVVHWDPKQMKVI